MFVKDKRDQSSGLLFDIGMTYQENGFTIILKSAYLLIFIISCIILFVVNIFHEYN